MSGTGSYVSGTVTLTGFCGRGSSTAQQRRAVSYLAIRTILCIVDRWDAF